MRWRVRIPGLALLAALAACGPRPQAEHPAILPGTSGPPWSAGALGHYRIDPARSQVLVLVYRAGTLAALGHDHVIGVESLSGNLTLGASFAASGFHCEFPVARLRVDAPADRMAAGPPFEGAIDQASIDGTRSHMLGEQQLDAARYPTITLQSLAVQSGTGGVRAVLRITVRSHAVEVPMQARLGTAADQITLQGEFDLTHAELGLTPYRVALGALRVGEQLHVRYRLLATRGS